MEAAALMRIERVRERFPSSCAVVTDNSCPGSPGEAPSESKLTDLGREGTRQQGERSRAGLGPQMLASHVQFVRRANMSRLVLLALV
jgi:hypothetical protein